MKKLFVLVVLPVFLLMILFCNSSLGFQFFSSDRKDKGESYWLFSSKSDSESVWILNVKTGSVSHCSFNPKKRSIECLPFTKEGNFNPKDPLGLFDSSKEKITKKSFYDPQTGEWREVDNASS